MDDAVDPAPRRPPTPREKAIVAILLAAFVGIVGADLAQTAELVVWSVPLIVLAWVPLLVLHEGAHALVARLLDWRVYRIVLGFGRVVARFRIGRTRVVLKRIPLTGFVEPVPTSLVAPRLKSALVYAAGPGVELVLAASIIAAVGPESFFAPPDGVALLAAQSVVVAVGIGAFFNLMPIRGSDGTASDGLGIFASAMLPRQSFEDRRSRFWMDAARRRLETGDARGAERIVRAGLRKYPSDIPLRAERAVCLAARGLRDEAVDTLNAIGDPNDYSVPRRVLLLHARGRIALELEPDAAILREGFLACEAALEVAPEHGPLEVTLGALLVERNRLEEGIEVLQRAWSRVRDGLDESRALAYLAIASRRLGRSEDANLYATALVDAEGRTRMLRRVISEGERDGMKRADDGLKRTD